MISLTAEQVVEMPVDELALAVVADLIATREWNEYNYLNSATQHPPFARDAYATRAVAEALCWARTHGLIARTPGQSADAAIFVTRAGQEAVTDGLVTVRLPRDSAVACTHSSSVEHGGNSSSASSSRRSS